MRTTKRAPDMLGRRLEVHQAERLADLEMLLRREAHGRGGARLAVAAHLDVVVLVRADGHLGERRVGDGGERGVELGDGGLLLGLGGRAARP